MEGERKQITVLFADMKGYTPLAERLGEEKIYGIMNRVYERMLNAVHKYEGTVQELTGDGILALFGAPIALEDAPVRASRAALEIQQQMGDLGEAIEAEFGVRPLVRIGMHTGPVVVGTLGTELRMEFKAVGDTVNLASRLESMAKPGTILISEVTHRLVDAYVDSTYVGEQKVKGKSTPQRCYRLHGMKAASERFDASLQRGLTPLVGLERELKVLKERLHDAEHGPVCVVDVVGEAGTGKSRLLYEFKQYLHGGSIRVLEAHCSASGRATAFFPIIEILKTIFSLHEHMGKPEIEARVREWLNEFGLESNAVLPLLLNLLGVNTGADSFRGLDAEIIGARTRDALKEVCKAYCHSSRTILLIEDLHWLDSATEELLQSLIEAGQPVRGLILATYRPEYTPPWSAKRNVIQLNCAPLKMENCARLVRHCLGPFAKSEDLVHSVVSRVEGNPLFAEELSRYLRDTTETGLTTDMGPPSGNVISGPIPESLRDIIMARVDRLEEGPRELLHIMSVLGREFPSDLIQHVWAGSNELPALVSTLEKRGLITGLEQGNSKKLCFRHVLIQEAVYDSLLANRRTRFHEQVAQALETLHPERPSEFAETLAYHWDQSSRPNNAIPYLAMAGKRSLGVYSLEEAGHWFQQVVDKMDSMPDIDEGILLADVLLDWARVLYYKKDFKRLIRVLEGHLERIEVLGDRRRLSLALFWLGFSHYFGARYDTSKALLHRSLELGRQQADTECIGYASLGLMFVYANLQDASSASNLELFGNEVIEAASHLSDVYLESKYLLCMTIHSIYMGRFCDAGNFCLRMRELGEQASDPRTIAMSQWARGFVNVFEEQFEEALDNAENSLKWSPDPLDRLMARTVKGVTLALKGNPGEGLLVLREVRKEMVDADYLAPLLGVDIPYGAAMAMSGKMRSGVSWIEDSIERFRKWGNKSQPAFGHLVLGEIYLQMALGKNKPPLSVMMRNLGFILPNLPFAARKARQHLERAVRECRELDVPANLARGLWDLALLYRFQKRTDEARACLIKASVIAKPQAPALHARITHELQHLPIGQGRST